MASGPTPETVMAFISLYERYVPQAVVGDHESRIAQMLRDGWGGLSPTVRSRFERLDHIASTLDYLPSDQRESADRYWRAVMGTAHGALSSNDPMARTVRFIEVMNI